MNIFKMPFSIISDKNLFFNEIRDGIDIKNKIIFQLIPTFIFFFIYGFVIGLSQSPLQGLSSAIKLPIMFLLTLFICFPTLYIFSLLLGLKNSAVQYFSVVLTLLTITSTILIAFAPISLFFVMTSKNYQFFKLLNVIIFTISGIIGLQYFNSGLTILYSENRKSKGLLFNVWIVLYCFVGSQLAWIMRPFFGHPKLPFEIFRDLNGNFYFNIIKAVSELLGFS